MPCPCSSLLLSLLQLVRATGVGLEHELRVSFQVLQSFCLGSFPSETCRDGSALNYDFSSSFCFLGKNSNQILLYLNSI